MKNNELFCARTAFLRLKNQKSHLSSNICNPQLTKDSLMVLRDDAQRCRHAVFCAVGDIPFYEGFVHKKYTWRVLKVHTVCIFSTHGVYEKKTAIIALARMAFFALWLFCVRKND